MLGKRIGELRSGTDPLLYPIENLLQISARLIAQYSNRNAQRQPGLRHHREMFGEQEKLCVRNPKRHMSDH